MKTYKTRIFLFILNLVYLFKNAFKKSPGVKIGKSTISVTAFLKKCLVFQVTSALGLVAMAAAKIGASEVGKTL